MDRPRTIPLTPLDDSRTQAHLLARTDDTGIEWVVDAYGCNGQCLRDQACLERVFCEAVHELGLHPIAPALFHQFAEPGGITGMLMLSESHLTCHSFPERGYVAFNLFCCRSRPNWPWSEKLKLHIGAQEVKVRRLERLFGQEHL